jgi:cytoskeletal protein RodZ
MSDGSNRMAMSAADRQQAADEFDRRIWRMVFIGGLLVAAVVILFGWRFVAPRLGAAKNLDHAVVVVKQADPVLAELDKAVNAAASSPTTATAAVLIGLQPHLAETRAQLVQSVAEIDAGMRRLSDDEQRAAVLVQAGAQARIDEIVAAQALAAAASNAAGNPSPANIATLRALATDPSSSYQKAKAKAAEAGAALNAL